MKAYIIATNKAITPFNEHPRDCLIVNKPLRQWQDEAFRKLTLPTAEVGDAAQVQDADEHLILADSLYVNADLLTEFISRSRALKQRTVCALKPGIATQRTIVNTQDVQVHDDRVEYQLQYVPAGEGSKQAVPVIINADRFSELLPMPEHMLGEPGYGIPLPEKLVIQIDHWTNLWSANIATLLAPAATLKKMPKWKLLPTALKARSMNQWKVVSKLNKIGRNCDIHPTAYVEGSVLGNNVTVGAGSVVRESCLGDHASVENNCTINFAVLGDGSYIADRTTVRYSVVYPDTFIGFSTLSCVLIGRGCFIGDATVLTDLRLDGKCTTVRKGDKVIDTDNRILGSCLGHGAYLAAGTILAPGREIPCGLRIAPEASRVLQRADCVESMPGFRQISVNNPWTRRNRA